jgi:hypothetical protein
MTREEAIAKAETGWWKTLTPEQIVTFQLYEDKLCMPFGEFHKAVGVALKRPVWNLEFINPEKLQQEFEYITLNKEKKHA